MEITDWDRLILLIDRRNLILERALPILTDSCREATKALAEFSLELQVGDFREDIEFEELTERFWDSYGNRS